MDTEANHAGETPLLLWDSVGYGRTGRLIFKPNIQFAEFMRLPPLYGKADELLLPGAGRTTASPITALEINV
jgi:hypothetical protein